MIQESANAQSGALEGERGNEKDKDRMYIGTVHGP